MLVANTLLATSLALAGAASALQKISRTGRYLYGEDGNRFYIKGLAYQEQGDITSSDPTAFPEPSDFVDPLADANGCSRDIPYMKQLGINAIRVYSVNASLNHDACMAALSSAGIYTIIDLSLPVNGSIDRASPTWSTNLLDLYLGTVEVFSKYDNVLAYNVGNEVANSNVTTVVAPFVKAAARDVKAYLKSQKLPQLIGYAAVDAPDVWRYPLAQYLSCGADSEAIDIYGLNNYEWCGDDTFQAAYANTENTFQNYNIPAYFSEFGCVKSLPRLWTETQALFGSQMTPVWSGGVAFSYFPAFGGFGMVNISSDTKSVTTGDDFGRLATEYNNISFIESPSSSSAGSTSFPSCGQPTDQFLASDTLPPTPNAAACNCVEQTFSCLFTPQTTNYSVILGELLNYGCSQLGQAGGNCDAIASDGQAGTYGSLSGCDPTIKLSYVMSSLYEGTNRNEQTCNFSGNATINSNAPPSRASAEAAAQSCLSASPAATFTPSSIAIPGTTAASSTGSGTTTATKGANTSNAAGSLTHGGLGMQDARVLGSVVAVVFAGAVSGLWLVL